MRPHTDGYFGLSLEPAEMLGSEDTHSQHATPGVCLSPVYRLI